MQTQPMRTEAAGAGFFADLLTGATIDMPPLHEVSTTFKKAAKAEKDAAPHPELPLQGEPEDQGAPMEEE